MDRMDENEYNKRMLRILQAKKMLVPHVTKNISTAFEIYMELMKVEDEKVFLNTVDDGNRPSTVIDRFYMRPSCPECGHGLRLRIIKIPQGNKNLFGYKTQWVCLNCAYEFYSKRHYTRWMKYMQRDREDLDFNRKNVIELDLEISEKES